MNRVRPLVPMALLASLACSASVTTIPPASAPGTAIMDWTIEGNKDPARCQASGAANFHVALFGSGGRPSGEFIQSCTAFATTIGGLVPDTYSGQAELIDVNGNARTTSINLIPFTVVENGAVTVAVDFPFNSFF